jgi:hypothetical protein
LDFSAPGAGDPGATGAGRAAGCAGGAGWPGPEPGADLGNTLIAGNGPFGAAGFLASVPLLKGPELDKVSLILFQRYRRNARKFREAHYDLPIETIKPPKFTAQPHYPEEGMPV